MSRTPEPVPLPASTYSTVFRWFDRTRAYAPLAATVAGLLYAAGFVIVNSYLGGYGVRDTDIVSARYVGAGLVFLVFVAIALAIYDNARIAWAGTKASLRPLVMIGAIAVAPVGTAVLETLIVWRALAGPLAERELSPIFDLRFLFALLVVNYATMASAAVLAAAARADLPTGPRRGVRGVATAFVVLASIGVVVIYAAFAYPLLPSFLGGGEPARVRLVLSQAIADACRPCVQDDVLLIDEGGNRLVVLVREGGRQVAVEIYLLPNGDRAVIHR